MGELGCQDNGHGVQAGSQHAQSFAQTEAYAAAQRQKSHTQQRDSGTQQRLAVRRLAVQYRLKQRHNDDGGVFQE